MVNPMLQFLSPKGNNLAETINKFTSTVKMSKNPALALQTLMQNNPNIQSAVDSAQKYIDQCGGDPEAAFRKFADQNGVSAENIIQMFK